MTIPQAGRLERFLTIWLLAGLAVSQPLFSLLGQQAEFLVAHDMGPAKLLAVTFLLGILLPSVLASLPMLFARVHRPAGTALFHALFIALSIAIALPVTKKLGMAGWPAAGSAAAAGLVCDSLWRRVSAVRLFFRYLSPAVIVFPLAFLFFSRATPLLSANDPSSGSASAGQQSTPDIVFLVLDEFPLVSLLTPDLEINRERFPNFARLADQANWYVSATTGAEVTVDAVPAALTGLSAKPAVNDLPITANHPRNLFTLLNDRYRYHVAETNTRLCPRERCMSKREPITGLGTWPLVASDLFLVYRHVIYPQPWADSLPAISNGWAGFGNETASAQAADEGLESAIAVADLAQQVDWGSRGAQFTAFIDQLSAGEVPQLYFFHALLPHRIWRYLPDGRQYLVDEVWEALDDPGVAHGKFVDPVFGHVWQNDPVAVQTARKRHLLQVQFVDTLLGRLLDRLEAQGMFTDSLIVIMGDHGASFVPGQPRRAITEETLTDISAVPLFIKLPGQAQGERVMRSAGLIDILPTIAETIGSRVDWRWDGESLLRTPGPIRETILVKNANGDVFTYPSSEHLPHLQARAAENDRAFGEGDVFAFKNLPWSASLLKHDPSEFSLLPAGPGRSFLDYPHLYASVDPDGRFVPLHLKGWVENIPNGDLPLELAVAVNGQIEAVARTFDIPGFETRFESLLPPESLRNGDNEIRLFRVHRSGASMTLRELPRVQSSSYRLLARGGQELLGDSQGNEIAVHPADDIGQVASYLPESAGLISLAGSVSGDVSAGAKIIAFANGRLSAMGGLESGQFDVPLSGSRAANPADVQVRVFLLDQGTAFELQYPGACSEHWHFAPPASWRDAECDATASTPLRWAQGHYSGALDFRSIEVRQFMLSGWDLEPGNISWTVHQRAELEIPVPADTGKLHFTAMVKPFLAPPEVSAQELFVLANDSPIASFQLDRNELRPIEWEVPPAILAQSPGTLRISLLVPNARSPRSVGAGEDLRLLGLAFTEMLISSGPDSP